MDYMGGSQVLGYKLLLTGIGGGLRWARLHTPHTVGGRLAGNTVICSPTSLSEQPSSTYQAEACAFPAGHLCQCMENHGHCAFMARSWLPAPVPAASPGSSCTRTFLVGLPSASPHKAKPQH